MKKDWWWNFGPNPRPTSTPKTVDYVVVDEHDAPADMSPSELTAFHEQLRSQDRARGWKNEVRGWKNEI